MHINPSNRLCQVQGIPMVINTDNGAVVGLDAKGLNQYEELAGQKTPKDMDPDFLSFLLDNQFVAPEPLQDKKIKPGTVYLHVSNNCNLHCLGCYSENDQRNHSGDESTDHMKGYLDELAKTRVANLVISGGEPLIRKDIHELMAYARQKGFDHITLITNGTMGDEALFEKLAASLDVMAVSLDTYASDCPAFLRDEGIFDEIMENIKKMQAAGLLVSILPTIHHKNIQALDRYVRLAQELKTQISFSVYSTDMSSLYDDYRLTQDDLKMISNHFSQSDIQIQDVPINNTLEGKKHCGTGCHTLSISADGKVYPCHLLMEESFCMGDLNQEKLKDVVQRWEGQKNPWEVDVSEVDQCRQCEYRYLCGGGCRARAFLMKGQLDGQDPFCPMFKNYYTDSFNRMKSRLEG